MPIHGFLKLVYVPAIHPELSLFVIIDLIDALTETVVSKSVAQTLPPVLRLTTRLNYP